MRRLLLVNALIFAVLAAAVALAYYGYSFATGVAQRERELELMKELAREKVNSIESRIVRDDQKLFGHEGDRGETLSLAQFIERLPQITADKAVHWMSVFVLDDKLKIVPGGFYSNRGDKAAAEFKQWFETTLTPHLGLADARPNQRGHFHALTGTSTSGETGDAQGQAGTTSYLFSFIKKVASDKTYYIVIEEDLNHLVYWILPQYFPEADKAAKRLYQVVDTKGGFIYGTPFISDPEAMSATEPFRDTVDGWFVRVTEAESSAPQLQRKRLVDSVFIGGAITVILAGFVFLALAVRRERKANDLKSEFISNVSHELKTPLSIITMFGEMLANGRTKGPEQSTEYAEIIWRESQRLGRLIDNVLDFSKIERGANVYDFAEADAGEVVERAVDLIQRRLATAEMSIDVKIDEELPQVQLDANAFTLAVMNLIDNAIKYASDGKKIELRLAKQGERLVLTVKDFGPGIDPDELDQVFERFYRARAVRLKTVRGSGIGLALVRHIARAHGGDVSVKSEVGKGATFELWLPIS